jgi:HEAT repeat protein
MFTGCGPPADSDASAGPLRLPPGYRGSAMDYLRSKQISEQEALQVGRTTTLQSDTGLFSTLTAETEKTAGTRTPAGPDAPAEGQPETQPPTVRNPSGPGSDQTGARLQSFRAAALNRDRAAVPLLENEIRTRGPLAPQAAEALGLIGDGADALMEALSERKNDSLAAASAVALARMGAQKAAGPIASLTGHRNFRVRLAALDALAHLGDAAFLPAVRRCMDDSREMDLVRIRAASAAARLGDKMGAEFLTDAFFRGNRFSRPAALVAMVDAGTSDAPRLLAASLGDENDDLWTTALGIYVSADPAVSIPALRGMLRSQAGEHAAIALGVIGDPMARPILERLLASERWTTRAYACEALARLGDAGAAPALIRVLQGDRISEARVSAAVGLGLLWPALRGQTDKPAPGAAPDSETRRRLSEATRDALIRAAGDRDPAVAAAAAVTLSALSGKDLKRSDIEKTIRDPATGVSHLARPSAEGLLRRTREVQREHLGKFRVDTVIREGTSAPSGAVLETPWGEKMLCRLGDAVYGDWRVVKIEAEGEGGPSVVVRNEREDVTIQNEAKPRNASDMRGHGN